MNEVQQILKNARDVIESGWCRGAYAKNKYGDSCDPKSGSAVEFCAMGAMDRVNDDVSLDAYFDAVVALGETAVRPVTEFNDKVARSKADVLALFDDAIEAAATEGAAK